MKTIVLILTTAFLTSFSYVDLTTVYICTGKHSKKYHLAKNCRGLSNCKGDIKEVYLNQAKHLGRALCGWED